ncbi:methionine synthase [Arthrobacter methylotrophus]|uniref:Cobalamin-independent methionine synthase MetE C-terminal/archaeal domain-containing protein n=1 Tax=Arthrobacter methylotrophus TaxID=121291 RepID=A0ABV5USD8_9MICC
MPAETVQKQVTATALGPWPGTDPAEAARVIRGELGSPHLPFLAELPDRGVGSDTLGRSASLLVDMAIDVQPHGWRLVDRPGKDLRRAKSALATDINVLADIAGSEESSAEALKIQLRGPMSLAAGLYLHNGERALLDYGARRDIAESLAAGVAEHVARIRAAVPGAEVVIQLDEPDIASVLAGTIPTSSGYRTLRSIPGEEVTGAWRLVIDALRAAGVVETVVAVPEIEAPIQQILAAGADGIAVPLKALTTRQWEHIATAVEAGKRLWAGALPTDNPRATLPRTAEVVDTVWRPWHQLGLPASNLGAVRVTPSGGLAGYSPSGAQEILSRLTQLADGLNQLALG